MGTPLHDPKYARVEAIEKRMRGYLHAQREVGNRIVESRGESSHFADRHRFRVPKIEQRHIFTDSIGSEIPR